MHSCNFQKDINNNQVNCYCFGCGDEFTMHLYNLKGEVENLGEEITETSLQVKLAKLREQMKEAETLLQALKEGNLTPATPQEVKEYLGD